MLESVVRVHHITALAGDPQSNLDFYTGFLGLRFVKRTVNFDDPAAWHFYFGGQTAEPGTLVTFFPWPNAPAGRRGTGQATALSLAVPKDSLDAWIEKARAAKIECRAASRFGESMVTLADPAGLPIELIASDQTSAVRLHSASLCVAAADPTLRFLTGILGAQIVGEEAGRTRLALAGTPIDILAMPELERAKLSAGMIHHIAWNVADEAAQLEWRAKLIDAGLRVTRVIDRQYFRSIYFREPGGVLFEIATHGPGFLIDESIDQLGTALKLPPWLEPVRSSIETRLPKVLWR